MLSLIICSRTSRISEELEKNISETIGCEYELVVIDNSKNKYSIFSAYNEGVRRAQGNNLCFMHDDILYKTNDWGTKVEKMLENESIGIIGVIGSYVMTKDYGYWDMMAPWVTGCVPLTNKSGWNGKNNCDFYFDNNSSNEVAAVDGMWYCMSKRIFSKIRFDEETYSGFHFYDMDICMQSLMVGYKNVIMREVEIVHYCYPQYNYQYVQAMKKFFTKWDENLPIYKGEAIGMSEKEYTRLYDSTKQYCRLLDKYTFYKNDIENSLSYKLGNAIAEPYRKIVRLLKRQK